MIVWTPELDATLLRLTAEGLSGALVGERMGGTEGSISSRLRRLRNHGFEIVRPEFRITRDGRDWTESEVRTLREHGPVVGSIAVGKLLTKSRHAVRKKANELGVIMATSRTTPRRIPSGFKWTEANTARLIGLVADGLSHAMCCVALGAPTRNAVVGKIHRLIRDGIIPPRQDERGRPKIPRVSVERRPAPKVRVPREPVAVVDLPWTPAPVVVAPVVLAEVGLMLKIPLADIGFAQCRWPMGDPKEDDFCFCGLPADGPYCPGHHRMAYQPGSKAKRHPSTTAPAREWAA